MTRIAALALSALLSFGAPAAAQTDASTDYMAFLAAGMSCAETMTDAPDVASLAACRLQLEALTVDDCFKKPWAIMWGTLVLFEMALATVDTDVSDVAAKFGEGFAPALEESTPVCMGA